jgi:cation transport ATPase
LPAVYTANAEEELSTIMKYVVALEQKSTHPLANAIIADYFGGCMADAFQAMSNGDKKALFPAIKKVKVLEGGESI